MASDRDQEVFEECVRSVVTTAERAAMIVRDPTGSGSRVEVPVARAGSRAELLAAALGLCEAELDFVWSVVARAVEPRVGVYLRAVFGNDARVGVSLAQHAAFHGLAPASCRALLRVLDPRHPLRTYGVIAPAGDRPHPSCPLRSRRLGFRQKLARGTGVAALFSGPPGTGKTMVAGLIAREMHLDGTRAG